jgi:NAD(P)-dependent dehydrogenase (short-subunit alcohol dehydrogenase family)
MAAAGKPIVLITGANTGLGLAAVKALCQSSTGYEILVGSRSVQRGEEAISTVKAEVPNTASSLSVAQVDIASDESIEKAANHVSSQYGRLDVLVNNAGASLDTEAQAGKLTTRDAWNKTWDVNVSGTQIMTEAFIPLLLKSADPRLIFITSGTASLTETESMDSPMLERLNAAPPAGWPKDPKTSGLPAYRSCKVGLNMMMREWCRVLRNDGVKVWAVSPGFLATGLSGVGAEVLKKMGAKDPSEGGEFLRDVIQGKRDHEQGKAIRAGMIQPW